MMNCDNAAAILTRLMEVTGTSQRKLAEKLGWSPQLLNSRLKKNTFPANDWIAAVRALGYQVTPHPDCIHIEHPRVDGICPDFKKTVDGVLYEKATASGPPVVQWRPPGTLPRFVWPHLHCNAHLLAHPEAHHPARHGPGGRGFPGGEEHGEAVTIKPQMTG